jgi:hypothetical protein
MKNGREPAERAIADEKSMMLDRYSQDDVESPGRRPLRGLTVFSRSLTWGSAALHPRLYAAVRSADCYPYPMAPWQYPYDR